ncbi:MAG: hypothetical protein K2K79_00545 [Paramuribaculum sp.]|nr:hypothetical protein [Paramuribaculum sp.]
MNLKKLLLVAFVAISAAMSAYGADLSREALNLRSQIKSYLSQEGYVPSIDEDGDIKFKYQGNTYFIQLFDIVGDIALRYMVGVTIPDNVSQARAKEVCLYVAQQKLCTRAIVTSSGRTINVQIDGFCSGISMFKDLFLTNMKLLDGVSDNVLEELAGK